MRLNEQPRTLSLVVVLAIFACVGCSQGYSGPVQGGHSTATGNALPGNVSAPIWQTPMYGGQKPSEGQQEIDRLFVESMTRTFGSAEAASANAALLGLAVLVQGNHGMAMTHFNQAWMLDDGNGAAYHGFALILIDRDRDLDRAEGMFQRAVEAPRLTTNAHADYGRFLLTYRKAPGRAVPYLEQALEQQPEDWTATANLAIALIESNRLAEGCEALQRALEHPDMRRQSPEFEYLEEVAEKPEACGRLLTMVGRSVADRSEGE